MISRCAPGPRGFRLRRILACVLSTIGIVVCLGSPGRAAATEPKRVLVLNSNQSVLPATVAVDAAIRRELQPGSAMTVEVFSEFLDTERFPEPEQAARMELFLRDKYARRQIDLVIATGSEALDFLVRRRDVLFPQAPLLFTGISEDELQVRHLPAGVTGFFDRQDPKPTLDLALALQPGARHLVVVLGAAPIDKTWEATAGPTLRAYQKRLDIRYLTGLPMVDLLREVSQLPPDTFILYLTVFRDGTGQMFLPRDVAEKLSAAANAPVYGVYETYLGRGIVGGSMLTFDDVGAAAGRLGRELLVEAKARPLPPPRLVSSTRIVDWRQLQRWGLSEALLPPGTVVRSRAPSIWDLYRWQIAAAGVLLVAQSVLILLLLLQGRRRRRAELSLQESEARMELAAVAAHIGLWHWDIRADRVWATATCRQMIGLEPGGPATLERFLGAAPADQRDTMLQSFREAVASGTALRGTWRMTALDGSDRWIGVSARLTPDSAGAPRIMGVLTDITHEIQARLEAQQRQQELTHLSRVATLGELSGAIAHELNQPLTAILGNAHAARLILARADYDLGQIREILEDVVADGNRAGEVIRRLRTMFRKAEALLEPLDINEVATEVLELAHGELLERRVRVTASLGADLPAVRGDRVQLQQVLLNIVINACDAMNDNRPAERGLVVTTEQGEAGMVQVAVADRGNGIEAAMLERLFEPFVTTKRDGLGLGLSICRSIVIAHGGRLWAANNKDRGATFCVALPAADMRAAPRLGASEQGARSSTFPA